MAIDDDEHGLGGAEHQAFEKLLEHSRVDGALVQHEAEIAARTDRLKHFEGEAAAGHGHDRCFPDRRPGGTGMIVRADAGLVCEVDVGTRRFASALMAG